MTMVMVMVVVLWQQQWLVVIAARERWLQQRFRAVRQVGDTEAAGVA